MMPIRSKNINFLCSLVPLLLLSGALFIFPLKAAHADTLGNKTLTAVEKKYTGKEFQADFIQISKLAALDITETASGKVWFSHPGKMRWLYLEPQRHEIITDGQNLWIFRPDQNQVMKGDAKNFFKAGAGGAFLSDISLMRKHFTIELKKTTADYLTFVLMTKEKNPDLVSILIRVSRSTHEIQRVTTRNIYGDTTLFKFTNIQFKKIDASTFDFKTPKGASIIKMD
ncbi:MAG: outer membrane lipoprotein carrier protein LolA [Desulfobacteraceae bacterium]|nr:outer membrane lipoprotein carrier protein LolA [Desulfobacteraceae bacterium]